MYLLSRARFLFFAIHRNDIYPEKRFQAPRWINWPANMAFFLELVCVGVAYFYLLRYLLERFV